MSDKKHKPFNDDVEKFGRYQYTGKDRLSSLLANKKNTEIIINAFQYEGKSVLDVGCGDGYFTDILRRKTKAKKILAIDPAATAIAIANKKYASKSNNLEFRNCYTHDLLKENQHFDIALCRGVLHHVENPKNEIKRILQLAQNVLIIDPNGLNIGLKLLEKFSSYHVEHQEKSYLMKHFQKWIEDAGGEMENYFFHGLIPMFAPDWATKLLQFFEPHIEAIPYLRAFLCGRMAIIAKSTSNVQ